MYRICLVFFIACITLLQTSLLAQNNSNSPYARYGYGKLSDQAFGNQRAMGGIGYGFRDSKTINPLNPASFSGVDSMTFMLDMGITGQLAWFNDDTDKDRKINGNIEYLAIQFPLYKKLGMGLGLKPISHVGYQYGVNYTDPTVYTDTYTGSGGISQLYTTLSYNFFQRLSLGINLGYLFGDISHRRVKSPGDVTAYNTVGADTMRTSGLVFDMGFQYTHPLTENSRLIIGGIYAPKRKFNEKVMETVLIYNYNQVIQNIERNVYNNLDFEMPQSFGLGASYNQTNKLTIGADFLLQQWSDAAFFSTTDTLSNRMKVNVGTEYIIDPMSRNFLRKMRYRAGAYYSDSYIQIRGAGYKEYGVSLGFGIPMIDNRSFINLAFEYSALRPEAVASGLNPLINEKYFKVTVSYTFNELWFFKRKVQ